MSLAPHTDPDLIVDQQNKRSSFACFCHVMALPYIVLLRRNFGTDYLAPMGTFFVTTGVSIGISAVLLKTFGIAMVSLVVKSLAFLVFICAKIAAEWNLMRSPQPRHRSSSGVSRLKLILQKRFNKWRIRIVVEPLLMLVFSLAALSPGALFGAIVIFYKELSSYRIFRVGIVSRQEPLAELLDSLKSQGAASGLPFVHTPPPPQAPPKVFTPKPRAGVVPSSAAATSASPTALPPPKGSGNSPSLIQRALNRLSPPKLAPLQVKTAPAPTMPSNRPAAVAPATPTAAILTGLSISEQDCYRLLEIPPSGIRDLEHLKSLYRTQLKRHHPDVTLDPARQNQAKQTTQLVAQAYNHLKSQMDQVGRQEPLL